MQVGQSGDNFCLSFLCKGGAQASSCLGGEVEFSTLSEAEREFREDCLHSFSFLLLKKNNASNLPTRSQQTGKKKELVKNHFC
jgi:hypothetical protein